MRSRISPRDRPTQRRWRAIIRGRPSAGPGIGAMRGAQHGGAADLVRPLRDPLGQPGLAVAGRAAQHARACDAALGVDLGERLPERVRSAAAAHEGDRAQTVEAEPGAHELHGRLPGDRVLPGGGRDATAAASRRRRAAPEDRSGARGVGGEASRVRLPQPSRAQAASAARTKRWPGSFCEEPAEPAFEARGAPGTAARTRAAAPPAAGGPAGAGRARRTAAGRWRALQARQPRP